MTHSAMLLQRLRAFSLLAVLAMMSLVMAAEYEIIVDNPCVATIKADGKVYGTIDLTSLDSKDPTKPAFQIVGGGYTYMYNPCTAMNYHTCNEGQTVCQTDTKSAFYKAGKLNETTYRMDGLGKVILNYKQDPTDANARQSIFVLECDEDAVKAPVLNFTGEIPSGHYNFVFAWKNFCHEIPTTPPPSGLGVGAILLICFFPSLVTYFIVGAVIQLKVRGAQGLEIIPNYNFWSSLPGLVLDGVRFAISPCTGGGPSKGGYEAVN